MAPDRERWAWTAIAVVGGALVVACVVPVFEVAIEARSVLGEFDVYRYEEEVTVAWDAGVLGVALLAAAVLVIAASLVAGSGRARPWLAVGTLLLSIGLFAAQGLGTGGATRWSDDATVYTDQDGGPLIEAAVARLRVRAAESPEAAQDSKWGLQGEDRFGLRRRGGGNLFFLSSLALFWLAGYRVARLRLSRWLAVLALAVVTIAAVLWSFIELLDQLEP